MNFSVRRDLGLQLLALYMLLVGPVVLASIGFDRLASQRLKDDVKAADLALARAIAEETNTAMDYALKAVEGLAGYPAVIEADPAGMETLFNTVHSARPDVNLVYRLDAEGIMLFHYPLGPGTTVGVDFSFREYFQRAQKTRAPLLSRGRISPTTEQPVTTAIMPLWRPNGKFLGLVATNITLQSLSTTLESITSAYRPEESFDVAIVDAAGKVIAHPNPVFLLTELKNNQPEVINPVLAGRSGNIIAEDGNGEERLFSYVPIPSAGWGVVISRPTAAAFATPNAFHQGVYLAIIIFLIVGVLFWVMLSRQVIQPLENLAVFSQTIGLDTKITAHQQATLSQLSKRSDQIGHLVHSLRRMEQAIEARLRELSTLLQTSAAVVSSLDSQTVLNSILEQVERLLDIKMCAIVALDKQGGIFRAQASRGLSQYYVEHIAIDPTEPQSVSH